MERLERGGGTGYRVSQGHPIQLQIQKTSFVDRCGILQLEKMLLPYRRTYLGAKLCY